jgi:cbb3-type cytochrome oxidase cytochrome c subunit
MKGVTALFLGIFGTFAFSWAGLTLIPNFQIGHLDPQADEEGTDIYPVPKSGMAERGRKIYAANGCVYCHSQQVRADYAASDIERKWGSRRSAPRDYLFERPAMLGKMRLGPDLANIGKRAPAEEEGGASPSPAATGPASSPGPGTAPAPSAAPPNAAASPSPSAAANAAASPAAPPSKPVAANSPAANPPSPNAAASPGASPAASPPANAATSPAASPSKAVAANSPAPAAATPAPSVAGPSPSVSPAVNAPTAPETTVVDSKGGPAQYSAAWHHLHLYSPRSVLAGASSNMPAYKFLYEERRITGERSADALKLTGPEAPGDGWEIVPSYDAKCLVAYLMSLDQSHELKEAKLNAAPAPASSPAAPKEEKK